MDNGKRSKDCKLRPIAGLYGQWFPFPVDLSRKEAPKTTVWKSRALWLVSWSVSTDALFSMFAKLSFLFSRALFVLKQGLLGVFFLFSRHVRSFHKPASFHLLSSVPFFFLYILHTSVWHLYNLYMLCAIWSFKSQYAIDWNNSDNKNLQYHESVSNKRTFDHIRAGRGTQDRKK